MVLSKSSLPPKDDNNPDDMLQPSDGYVVRSKPNAVQPLHSAEELRALADRDRAANPAVSLIREKISRLYDQHEPDAAREAAEVSHTPIRSQHQQFMYELSTSGKSLADIQAEWHQYYQSLPDDQKHQVWQEFYEANTTASATASVYPRSPDSASQPQPNVAKAPAPAQPAAAHTTTAVNNPLFGEPEPFQWPPADTDPQTPQSHYQAQAAAPVPVPAAIPNTAPNNIVVAEHEPIEIEKPKRSRKEIQGAIKKRVQTRGETLTKTKQNLHSLMFGLATGSIVLLIFMFGFFNEIVIAPFIQPGRATATPIIIDNDSVAADGQPRVIIPKINVEIPVIYGLTSNAEENIQNNLEDGVVHYPTTEVPGQKGNVAIFGHSSNNIFNKGQYKFAFVLLHTLKKDDTFYLTFQKKVYAYKVFSTRIVDPSEISVLDDIPGHPAAATLITCDPPGTSLHRLVVVGDQISPNPAGNKDATSNISHVNSTTGVTRLTDNGPTLWSRFWNWLF